MTLRSELSETLEAEAQEIARTTVFSVETARQMVVDRASRLAAADALLDLMTVRTVPNRADRRRAARERRKNR